MAQPKDPAGSGDKGAMRIDPALVRELAELLTDNELTEIEVEDGDRRIKVKREARRLDRVRRHGVQLRCGARAERPADACQGRHRRSRRRKRSLAKAVKSPMVGTAFCRPSPAPSRSSRSASR